MSPTFGYFSPRQHFPLLRPVWSLGAWLDLESYKVAEPANLPDPGECDNDLAATLPTTTTLGADSKFYLSSAGKTLHLYPTTCPGRHARLQTFRVCINCINRLTAASKQPPRGGKGIRHLCTTWFQARPGCSCLSRESQLHARSRQQAQHWCYQYQLSWWSWQTGGKPVELVDTSNWSTQYSCRYQFHWCRSDEASKDWLLETSSEALFSDQKAHLG